jgi:hypothetical protein
MMVAVPRVTMTAFTPARVTSPPFTAPTRVPVAMPAAIASARGAPDSSRLPAMTDDSPMFAPTERSNSPQIRGTSTAMAATISTAWLPVIAWKFVRVGNVSVVAGSTEKTIAAMTASTRRA